MPKPRTVDHGLTSGRYVAITPHNSTDFTDGICVAIYVGVGGDVVAVDIDGNATTFKNAQSGVTLPIKARRVNSTGTTATNLVALY